MTINFVEITNWESPGETWWGAVQKQPDKPSIEATMRLTLSWNEYHKMLASNNTARCDAIRNERKA